MLNPLVLLDLFLSACFIAAAGFYSYRIGKMTGYIRPWIILGISIFFGTVFLVLFLLLADNAFAGDLLISLSLIGGISLFSACLCAYLGMYTLYKSFEKVYEKANAHTNSN